MGRPVEYTRARRMAMQAVLTLVLGISILLAWLLSRAHAARVYPAKWETRKVGNFSVDVPAGWKASLVRSRFDRYIEIDEGGQKHGGRQIRIFDDPIEVDRGSSSLDVAMSFFKDEFSAEDFRPLDFLGQQGVWIEVPSEMTSGGPRQGFLAAFALLHSNRLVWIQMSGPSIFVRGDMELFKRLIRSLKDTRGKGQTVAKPDRRDLAYVFDGSSGTWAFGEAAFQLPGRQKSHIFGWQRD